VIKIWYIGCVYLDVVNNWKMKTLKTNRIPKLTILAIGLLAILFFSFKGKITHEPFDSIKWKNWTETDEEMTLRWDMMNSLRNNYELIGKHKTEIIELLGNPESETQSEFYYYLGYSKHGINTGNLKIQFDKNENVVEYSVWEG
jgi:hypothetical protein